MIFGKIAGVNKKISKLILGNENQRKYSKAVELWDYWFENGGNAFDNSMNYSEGKLEIFLGKWIKSRGVENEIISITKAGNTNSEPSQLNNYINQSLERLKLKYLDIFILHHDNTEIPPGEYIDALNQLVDRGLIKSFGASNWKMSRFQNSIDWAKKNNKIPFSLLNNNLSLAKMMQPLWTDSVSCNDDKYLNFLEKNNHAHLSWSCQARGFFINENIFKNFLRRKYLKYLKKCFNGTSNLNRKKRAEALAEKYNCTANDIALSWVLNQSFPSFGIIGSKNIKHLKYSLKCLEIKLSENELMWLNLKKEKL